MKPIFAIIVAYTALASPFPAGAVDSIYLEDVAVTNPGEYLAPLNLYSEVPPPQSDSVQHAQSLIELTGPMATTFQGELSAAAYVPGFYGAYRPSITRKEDDPEATSKDKLRVRVVEGVEHASDVPFSAVTRTLRNSDSIELVGKGEIYDIRVEVETMKLETSPIVFIVINAYKDVGSETLSFYNNFGYLGEQKLSEGAKDYARQLESAILQQNGE